MYAMCLGASVDMSETLAQTLRNNRLQIYQIYVDVEIEPTFQIVPLLKVEEF